MDVGTADAERGHAGAARTAGPRPGPLLGQDPHVPCCPVDLRRRRLSMQSPRQNPVTHRQNHLGDPRDPSRRLGVTDVRLHRPQPQRLTLLTTIPVHRKQRLRLDRITQSRPRAMSLDRIHLSRSEPSAHQRLTNHPLLGGTVGGRQSVGGTVLVDRTAPDDRQHFVPMTLSVRQAFQDQHPSTLGPAHAVGRVRECLTPAVRSHALQPGEFHEGLRSGHHGRTTGQRH